MTGCSASPGVSEWVSLEWEIIPAVCGRAVPCAVCATARLLVHLLHAHCTCCPGHSRGATGYSYKRATGYNNKRATGYSYKRVATKDKLGLSPCVRVVSWLVWSLCADHHLARVPVFNTVSEPPGGVVRMQALHNSSRCYFSAAFAGACLVMSMIRLVWKCCWAELVLLLIGRPVGLSFCARLQCGGTV